MSVIQQAAAERAVKLLAAAGLKFAVILADGTKLGDLGVIEHKKRRKVNNLRQHGYIAAMKSMKAGEVKRFQVPAGVEYVTWSSAISSVGVNTFGRGNFITAPAPDRSYTEALRVE